MRRVLIPLVLALAIVVPTYTVRHSGPRSLPRAVLSADGPPPFCVFVGPIPPVYGGGRVCTPWG
jgi:hypothetical protein